MSTTATDGGNPMDRPYRPRHARPTDPRELPPAMRGLADLITVIDATEEN